MTLPDQALILHNYFRSSAAYRVRIAMHLKGLSFDYLPVHLTGKQEVLPHRRYCRIPDWCVVGLSFDTMLHFNHTSGQTVPHALSGGNSVRGNHPQQRHSAGVLRSGSKAIRKVNYTIGALRCGSLQHRVPARTSSTEHFSGRPAGKRVASSNGKVRFKHSQLDSHSVNRLKRLEKQVQIRLADAAGSINGHPQTLSGTYFNTGSGTVALRWTV